MKTLKKVLTYMRKTPPEGEVFTDEETAQGHNYFGSWIILIIGTMILITLMFV